MKYTYTLTTKCSIAVTLCLVLLAACFNETAWAAKKETFDIIYLRTKDFDKILDYKEELETVFDAQIVKKLNVVGTENGEFILLYDGNLSARTVSRTLIKHAEMLSKTGFDEPYSTKQQGFYSLYNVSYGMGRNLDSLKQTYQLLYSCLGEEVKRDLFIEKTDYGNYLLVYRLLGNEGSATAVAKQHQAILKKKNIATSLTKENSNTVVYGESSLINDGDSVKSVTCQPSELPNDSRISLKNNDFPGNKMSQPSSFPTSKVAPPIPGKVETAIATANPDKTADTAKGSQFERLAGASSEGTKIEQAITEHLDNLKSKGILANDESTGWMVYDLENDRSLASINANIEFQAASMIKPYVALAFFHKVREGRLQYDEQSRRQMEAMIQRSSNSATNFIMRRAGGPEQCNAILKKYYGSIFKKTEIKEYIPADGRTYLNSSSPADYVRFLRALWNLDVPYGKEIRRVMALPGRDRLYYGTTLPRGTLVFNKTGSTARLCGDMGILVPKTRKGDIYPYAIVGIIERRTKASDYGQWMASRSRVIRDVSTLVYEGLKKDHHLL